MPLTRSATAAIAPEAEKTHKSVRESGWNGKLALSVEGSDCPCRTMWVAQACPIAGMPRAALSTRRMATLPGEHIDGRSIQPVVDKFILLDFLKIMASQNPGTVSLTPQKDIYAAGDKIAFNAPCLRL